jgi:hypothetical protein
MFEKVITKPFYLSRHRAAPLARERELFLGYLHSGGNRLGNLRITAGYLLQIVRYLSWRLAAGHCLYGRGRIPAEDTASCRSEDSRVSAARCQSIFALRMLPR